MNWRKLVAREYLYILVFAVGSTLLYVLLNWLISVEGNPPTVYNRPDRKGGTRSDLMIFLSDTEQKQITELTKRFPDSVTKEAIQNELKLRDSLRPIALARWEEQVRRYENYWDRKYIAEHSSKVALFVPYAIFLFLRSIIWSVRTVRKNHKS